MTPRPPRRIHVDGREYRWYVRFLDAGHVSVRAWLDEPDRRRQLAVSVPFDDFWLNFTEIPAGPSQKIAELFDLEPVTPALAADLVRAGVAAGWQPETRGEPSRFAMVGDRTAFDLVPE